MGLDGRPTRRIIGVILTYIMLARTHTELDLIIMIQKGTINAKITSEM